MEPPGAALLRFDGDDTSAEGAQNPHSAAEVRSDVETSITALHELPVKGREQRFPGSELRGLAPKGVVQEASLMLEVGPSQEPQREIPRSTCAHHVSARYQPATALDRRCSDDR